MHTIENDHIRISVRDKGAELTSVFHKKTGIEHLWQADPAYWGWHAPVLFPVVGRCWNDTISIDGKAYKMEKHGFARNLDFDLVSQGKDSLSFKLSSNESTLSIYPYLFDFYIDYELKGPQVVQSFQVVNKGKGDMLFSLGGHPAFAVPFLPGEEYEDYHIEFEKDTVLDRENINDDGFFDTSISNVINGTNKLPLERDMFYKDAIILKELESRQVTIKSRKNPHSLSVAFPDFKYLGLWAKVNAPYVCIEPWLGCADIDNWPTSFKDKEGVLSLPSLGKFDASFVITVS